MYLHFVICYVIDNKNKVGFWHKIAMRENRIKKQ